MAYFFFFFFFLTIFLSCSSFFSVSVGGGPIGVCPSPSNSVSSSAWVLIPVSVKFTQLISVLNPQKDLSSLQITAKTIKDPLPIFQESSCKDKDWSLACFFLQQIDLLLMEIRRNVKLK